MNQDKQPEALRLADVLEILAMDMATPRAAASELRAQYACIAELEAELAALKAELAAQAVEPYAVLVREIGESSFFDSKPIKPGSVQHQHAKSSPHYDYVELYAHPSPQAQDVQDAKRLDWMDKQGRVHIDRCREGHIKGPLRWDVEFGYEDGEAKSKVSMRAAIDAAIAASAKGGA